MAITITTINNEAASARTFVELTKNETKASWLNTSDNAAGMRFTLDIQQRITGRAPNGTNYRQSTVTVKVEIPAAAVAQTGLNKNYTEVMKFVMSLHTPESPTVLTATNRHDVVAIGRNFMTAANVTALAQGQL